jgi:hypothetical protein
MNPAHRRESRDNPPMDENDPVDDGEHVYRRIHAAFFVASLPVPIQSPAFRPTSNDTTGHSCFREQFLQRPEDAFVNLPPDKAANYYLARLAVSDLRRLGLTVVPEPVREGPPGHAVVPELSWGSYQADKRRWKPILVELAKLASAAIIHRPAAS